MLINGEKMRSPLNVKRSDLLKEDTLNVNVLRKTEHLVEKFKSVGYDDAGRCYFFFKKCFENLSEDIIWSLYESTMRNPNVESKIKYFIGACRNQMALLERKSA